MKRVNGLLVFWSFQLIWIWVACHSATVWGQVVPGAPTSVTVQQPELGVSIDANGILNSVVFSDADRRLQHARVAAAHDRMPAQLKVVSPLRKISLRRMEMALQAELACGRQPSNEMSCLAGLTRVEYVFVMPEERDILIAGPAEPWVENIAGQTVGFFSGRPVVLLEDWLVALRRFSPGSSLNAWVACSIDPTQRGLQNLKDFHRNLPHGLRPEQLAAAAEPLANELRDRLGLFDVRVYGIDPKTHAARVMIEADYRMKLIAVGLEPPPVPIRTFVSELKGAPRDMQRWWLTPEYQSLLQSLDRLAVRVTSGGVRLQTENLAIGVQANLHRSTTKPSRAARAYSQSFTENYESLAAANPLFAQLRNVMDCFILAAWLLKSDAYQNSGWTPVTLLAENQLPLETHKQIKQSASFVNIVWRNNVLLLPSGGGVSLVAAEALTDANLKSDRENSIKRTVASERLLPQTANWWWD